MLLPISPVRLAVKLSGYNKIAPMFLAPEVHRWIQRSNNTANMSIPNTAVRLFLNIHRYAIAYANATP